MKKYISSILLVMSATMAVGCSGNHSSSSSPDSLPDSIPSTIRELSQAIQSDDAEHLSRLFSYPLERPYPLRDIQNAEEMRNYYSILIDDSLKKVIAGPDAKQWQQFGWRGWSIDDGQYIWVDSLIYHVPYLSRSERDEQMRLIQREMQSLWPEMSKGWIPVLCLKSTDTGDIFRIDRRSPEKSSSKSFGNTDNNYRIAIYKNGENLSGRPSYILDGTLHTEGTMQSRIYNFSSGSGMNIEFNQDMSEGNGLNLIISSDGQPETYVDVIPVYWRDLNVSNSK